MNRFDLIWALRSQMRVAVCVAAFVAVRVAVCVST